jgi:predicted nucleic acid-binding protein
MKSTRDRFFIDTNILVYANDRSNLKKQRLAREIIAEALRTGRGFLSTQVLQEFFTVATKKANVAPDNARAQVVMLSQLDCIIIDKDIIIGAIDLNIIHRISFWDALIVKSASIAGCRRLLSEDLHHGQTVDGVFIENPFFGLD